MLITTVQSGASRTPKIAQIEVIEISDDEDEPERPCKAYSTGNCRRQATPKRKPIDEDRKSLISSSDSNKRLRTSNATNNVPKLSNGVHSDRKSINGGDIRFAENVAVADENIARVSRADDNLTKKSPRRLVNGSSASTCGSTPSSSDGMESPHSARFPDDGPVRSMSPRLPNLKSRLETPTSNDKTPSLVSGTSETRAPNPHSVVCKEEPADSPNTVPAPPSRGTLNQKKFLKPPSPKPALTKKDFAHMSLEEVDDLITKHGSHIIQNITIKDIQGKGMSEIKIPRNLKVTPQLKPKLRFKEPISADDVVIVISDDETAADCASQEDSATENLSKALKTKFRAQEDFLANLQLFHGYKPKKPLKKDITNILKTRNNMKSYIANPLVSILKADCIYKYVTNKGILSSEQFRAKKEIPRRKKKTASRQASRNKSPVSKTRKSDRRTAAYSSAYGPKRFVRRFLTKKLREGLRNHEQNGIWTSYNISETTQCSSAPVIVLSRIDPEELEKEVHSTEEYKIDEHERDAIAAQAKETKCKWCPFRCLSTPSLREHCFDFHGKIYPTVI